MKFVDFQKWSKRKIAFSILIVIIILINVIVSSLIFIDIQVIKTPEMTLDINIIEINSDEIVLQTKLNIANPNQFGLIIKDLLTVTTTNDGTEIINMLLKGGEITSYDNKTFVTTDEITFDGDIPKNLTTQITGVVGLKFLGFIKKTLPIVFNVKTSLEEAMKNIALPIINIKGNFGDITNDGIEFETEIEIKNQNTFDIKIDKLSVILKTETDELVGNFIINGGLISAKSTKTLVGGGTILLEALNAKTLFINLSAKAGLLIAGITKSIEIATEMQIKIPNLGELFSSTTPTEAFIDADMKLTRQGILNWGFTSYMTLRVVNPNNIGLIARDVTFSIYRVDDEGQVLVGDCVVNESYVGPENTTAIPAEILLPLNSIFKGQRLFIPEIPNGFLVVVRANLTISGLDQQFWIGVSGYQDLHMFR